MRSVEDSFLSPFHRRNNMPASRIWHWWSPADCRPDRSSLQVRLSGPQYWCGCSQPHSHHMALAELPTIKTVDCLPGALLLLVCDLTPHWTDHSRCSLNSLPEHILDPSKYYRHVNVRSFTRSASRLKTVKILLSTCLLIQPPMMGLMSPSRKLSTVVMVCRMESMAWPPSSWTTGWGLQNIF